MRKTLIPLLIILASSALITQADLASASTPPLREDLKLFVTRDAIVVGTVLSGGDLTLRGLDDSFLDGVSRYRLIASYVIKWPPEFYILGEEGYKALPISPVPKEGLTLIVDAEDQRQAELAAQTIGKVIKAAFTPISAEGSRYTYYSHIDFKLVEKTLFNALPELKDGFTNLLLPLLNKKDLQIIMLEAQRDLTGFSRQLTLLYAEAKGLTKLFEFDSILPGFSNTTASKEVAETMVEVIFADTLVHHSTSLKFVSIVNFPENVSSKVSFKLGGGESPPISKIDLIYYPPLIKAERLIDKGVVEAVEGRDTVEVTVRIQNTAPAGSLAAEGVTLEERWWRDKFDLVSGKTSLMNITLKAGEKAELQYVIKVKEGTPSEVLVKGEDTPITYTYSIGDLVLNGKAYPNDVRLILNKPRPTLVATAEAQTPTTLQALNKLTVRVSNVGSRSAENVSVISEGVSVAHTPILRALDSWTVEVPVKPQDLTQPFRNVRVLVSWVDEEGRKNLFANAAPVLFSRSTLGAPKVSVTQSASIASDESGFTLNGVVRAAITSTNETLLKLTTKLLEDFELVGGDFTAKERSMEVTSKVSKEAEQVFSYTLRSSRHINFVQPPIIAEVEWSGLRFKTASNSYAYAEGVKIEQHISKPIGFKGSTATVEALVVNLGPFPIYDLKVKALNYSYVKASYVEKSTELLDVGQTLKLEFNISYITAGAYNYIPIGGSFIFSAQNHSVNAEPILISVEKPITLSLRAPSSLIEKQETQILLRVSNPSSLTATDIDIRLAFSGVDSPQAPIEFKISELKAGEMVDKEVRIIPSSVFSLKISPTISFNFDGETLSGEAQETEFSINENLQMRYALPVALGAVLVIATAYILRKVSKENQLPKLKGEGSDL